MKGVNYSKSLNKWRAYIANKHLGYFEKESDAIKCRKEAESNYDFNKWRSRKLTKEKVLEIRSSKKQAKVFAIDYGVHISLIYAIRNNKYWTHV